MIGPGFEFLFHVAETGVIACMLAINLIFFAMLIIGCGCIRRERESLTRSQTEVLARSPLLPGVSVLVPVPDNLRALGRQRNRWQRGALESLSLHRGILFHPRWGAVAFFGLPAVILLEALAPPAEGLGYLVTLAGCAARLIQPGEALLFAVCAILFGLLLSVSSVLLDEAMLHKYPKPGDLWRLLAAAVLENFGYHQLTCCWRIAALWQWLRGRKDWGARDFRSFPQCTRQTLAAESLPAMGD